MRREALVDAALTGLGATRLIPPCGSLDCPTVLPRHSQRAQPRCLPPLCWSCTINKERSTVYYRDVLTSWIELTVQEAVHLDLAQDLTQADGDRHM